MARFDWIPYLQGKYLSYYQWFAFIGSFAALVLAIGCFVIYYLLNNIRDNRGRYGFLLQDHAQAKWLKRLKSFFFNLAFYFLAFIPWACSALDVIYFVEGVLGMMAILTIGVFLDNGRKNWNVQQDQYEYVSASLLQNYLRRCLTINKDVKRRLRNCAISSLILPILGYQTCICFFNEQIGYYNFSLGFGINTYFTRLFQLKQACPPGPPCQMYATVPQNPEQAFFLNLHTHTDVKRVIVYYQQFNDPDPQHFLNVTAETYQYPALEWKSSRAVHSALIYDLKPNTKYFVKVFYNNQFWTNAIYKTLPSDPSTPVRMINAGDSGYTRTAINLTKIASTLKPDIFIMAGDVAYDDNMPACAYTWDYFLGMYGRFTTTVGYLVPLVLGVGNHDVGLNQIPHVNITIDNYGPAFFLYFPQHYDYNLNGYTLKKVPPLNRRKSFFNFTFSNIHYMALDTGYLQPFDGFQKRSIIESFQANRDKVKFVGYHVPIYSACEAFDRSPERFIYALFHWVPNFDKYHVMAAFQNHVHSFKRTKPLVGSTPTENGTVYLGDGAYGTLVREHCQPDVTIDIFDSFAQSNNFWLSQVGKDKVKHTAYDSYGVIIDQFEQDISAYVFKDEKHKAIKQD